MTQALVAADRADEVEAVAVALLFSFLDPAHERRVRDAFRRVAPDLHVSVSSDICPEFREYERTCTTVMNAYVMPKVDRLVARLDRRLRAILERLAHGHADAEDDDGGGDSNQPAEDTGAALATPADAGNGAHGV